LPSARQPHPNGALTRAVVFGPFGTHKLKRIRALGAMGQFT
jgi:hypothetical protein